MFMLKFGRSVWKQKQAASSSNLDILKFFLKSIEDDNEEFISCLYQMADSNINILFLTKQI